MLSVCSYTVTFQILLRLFGESSQTTFVINMYARYNTTAYGDNAMSMLLQNKQFNIVNHAWADLHSKV